MECWKLFFVLIYILILGCSRETANELFNKGEAATHQVTTYPRAESNLTRFLRIYPDDPRVDVALQALARVLMNQERNKEAIARYNELIRRFPNSRYATQAQFMIGYIYDQAKNYEQARIAYRKVIERYPESDLVDDSEKSIENLGKPLEAWIFPESSSVSTTQIP